MSEIKKTNMRGRPLGRWKDRVKGMLLQGGEFQQAKRECLDRER